MTKQKTILFSAIAVLLLVYIFQVCLSFEKTTTEISIKDKPDFISLEYSGNITAIKNNGTQWLTEKNQYPIGNANVNTIMAPLENLKILEKVSTIKSESALSRFGLSNPLVIKATLKNTPLKTLTKGKSIKGASKKLSAILIGKPSSTGNQTYIKFEGNNDVYLASGDFSALLSMTEESLRDKNVISVKKDEIVSLQVMNSDGMWALEKTGENEKASWAVKNVVGISQTAELDSEKLEAYLGEISTIAASGFASDDVKLPITSETEIIFNAGLKTIKLTVYKIENSSTQMGRLAKTDEVQYLCTSSETPYKFYIPSYKAQSLKKSLADLSK
jgi:hypothetical protein